MRYFDVTFYAATKIVMPFFAHSGFLRILDMLFCVTWCIIGVHFSTIFFFHQTVIFWIFLPVYTVCRRNLISGFIQVFEISKVYIRYFKSLFYIVLGVRWLQRPRKESPKVFITWIVMTCISRISTNHDGPLMGPGILRPSYLARDTLSFGSLRTS